MRPGLALTEQQPGGSPTRAFKIYSKLPNMSKLHEKYVQNNAKDT